MAAEWIDLGYAECNIGFDAAGRAIWQNAHDSQRYAIDAAGAAVLRCLREIDRLERRRAFLARWLDQMRGGAG